MKKTHASCILAVVLVVILSVFMTTVAGAVRYMGDINGDGKVRSDDARMILRHTARIESLSEEQQKYADLTGDGKILSEDARLVLRMAARLESLVEYSETTAPDKPTVPDEPSTAPDEPTTVPDEPSTAPAEPTTVPVEPSTAPVEPTTVPSEPSTAPVEPTTVPEEPSTEPPTEPEPVYEVDPECYVKAVVEKYAEDGTATTQNVEYAYSTAEDNGETVGYHYTRSDTLFAGNDVAMLVREKVVDGKVVQDYYILNYVTKKYLCLDSELNALVHNAMGGETQRVVLSANTIAMVVADETVGMATEEVNGVAYATFSVDAGDGSRKYYMHRIDGREFYEPAMIESYDKNGKLTAKMTVITFDPVPDAYVAVPTFDGLTLTTGNAILELADAVEFLKQIGITVDI